MVVNWELYCELPESLVDLQPLSNPPTLPSPPQPPPPLPPPPVVASASPPPSDRCRPFVNTTHPPQSPCPAAFIDPLNNHHICLYNSNKQTKRTKMSPAVVSSNNSSSSPFSSSSSFSSFSTAASPGECYTHDYDEYEFLNAKPEVDSRRRHYAGTGGACGGGTGNGGAPPVGKGRRNAAEALAYRKLARQAYLIKSVVSGGGGAVTAPAASGTAASADHPAEAMAAAKKLGKKRRARLLSDHLQDFNVAVPYSLNRKNRWRTACDGAAEAVKTLSAGAGAADVRLKFSVVESYFDATRGLEDERRVIAYRELDANGALTKKRSARSARGAPLASLLAATTAADKENNTAADVSSSSAAAVASKENITYDLNIQYHFTRVHPATKLAVGGKTGAGKQKARGAPAKRRCRVNMARSVYGNAALDLDLYEEAANAAATPAPLAETAGELSSTRAPARRTYTLADFVQEGALVRRTAAASAADAAKAKSAVRNSASAKELLDECQFVVTDAPIDLAAYNFESSSAVSDTASVIGDDDASGVADSDGAAPKASIVAQWSRRYAAVADTRPLDYTLSGISAARYGIHSHAEWNALLDGGDNILLEIGDAWWASDDRLAVDLSAAILARLKATGDDATSRRLVGDALLLVAVVQRVNSATLSLRLNGSFKWDVDASLLKAKLGLHETFGLPSCRPFSGLFTAIADECAPAANEHFAKNLSSAVVKTSVPRRLAPLANAFTLCDILRESRAESAMRAAGGADASFEVVEDGEHTAAVVAAPEVVEADDDDFERIEMDEFVVEERPEADAPEHNHLSPVLAAHHQRCNICDAARSPLEVDACGHRVCAECMRAALARRSADANAAQQSLLSLKCPVASCTGGELTLDALAVDVPLPLVVRFAVAHFVRRHGGDPTKTLSECPNCAAFVAADQPSATNQLCCGKCATAFCVSCTRAAHWPLSCAQAARWSTRCAQLCTNKSDAARTAAALGCTWRARRADATTHFQMTRQMCRLRDAKSAQRFGELRQTALYLLEFGYAWLDAANHQQRGGSNKTDESDALSAPLDAKRRAQLKRLLGSIRLTVESVDDELLFCGALTDATKLGEKVDEMDASLERFMALAAGGKAEKPKAEDINAVKAAVDADDLEHFDLGEL